MPRSRVQRPTDAELELLQVLWARGPSELAGVRAGLERPLAASTVATVLKVMWEKGLVLREQRGRTSLWSAALSREEAGRGAVRRLLDKLFDGSGASLVARMIEDGELAEDDRAQLRALLAEHDASSASEPARDRGERGSA